MDTPWGRVPECTESKTDSESQVKVKLDSFIEGMSRPLIPSTSQGLTGSGCYFAALSFPHWLLLLRVSASAVSGSSGRP